MLSCGSPHMSKIEYCRKHFVANCFGNFGKKKSIEKIANIAKKITNSTRIANFVAILAKICLIEIACRNLVFKSAKSAN